MPPPDTRHTPATVPYDDPERMVFFSDAVFAIAMTLLVLDLKPSLPPEPDRHMFEAALLERLPGLIAFVISFVVLAGAWLTHHNRFRHVSRYDGRLLGMNLALLFLVAFTPVPTALVFARTGGSPWAAVLYAATLGLLFGVLELQWAYAHRHGFLDGPEGERAYRRGAGATVPVAAVFLLSVPIALLAGERWATASWALIAPVMVVAHRLRVRRTHGEPSCEVSGEAR